MKRSNPLYPIKHLIGDPGFTSRDDLGSFCLSVGLFQGKQIQRMAKPPKNWNPWSYDTWPMLEIIAYTMDPTLKDRSAIKDLLYDYYLGGVDIVARKVANRNPMEALKKLSDLIPP